LQIKGLGFTAFFYTCRSAYPFVKSPAKGLIVVDKAVKLSFLAYRTVTLKKPAFFSLVVILTVLSTAVYCPGGDKGFQYRSTGGFSLDLDEDWELEFEEELHFINGGGNFAYQHSDLGFVYTGFAHWLNVGFNYRQVFEKDSEGVWRRENRPHLNASLKGRLNDIAVSSRSRLEFRDRETESNLWRYRNKVTFEFPVTLTDFKLSPYLADEVFINFDHTNYSSNRLYAGFKLALARDVKAEIFYLWQHNRSSNQRANIDALGAAIKFSF